MQKVMENIDIANLKIVCMTKAWEEDRFVRACDKY